MYGNDCKLLVGGAYSTTEVSLRATKRFIVNSRYKLTMLYRHVSVCVCVNA